MVGHFSNVTLRLERLLRDQLFFKKRASQGARDLTRLVECCSPMQETLVPSPDHINQGCESHL